MTIRYYPNTGHDAIPAQAQIAYEDYEKIKGFEDVGYFLTAYVVNGGAVTANATRNDMIDATDIVVSLNDDIMAREGVSFQTTTPNTTYYLDFAKEGDWSWGTAHPAGTVGVDYLTVASVSTDANGLVNVIIDTRGPIGGFRLKSDYGFEDFVTTETFNEHLAANATRIVDLFAMSGQSNMQGQSESAPVPFEINQYQAHEYKLLTNSLTTVKHPFGENIDDLLLAAHNGWGSLSPKFAESYFNTSGTPPLMVGVAKGATVITDWIGNARYAKVVEKVNGAVAAATANNLIVRNKCFVWLQGESDGISTTTKQVYKQKFITLWNALKRDCGFTKFLIIRVAKFYEYGVMPIIEAQEELAREYDDVFMLTRITGTFTIENGLMQSNWHYTNAGYDLVGSMAGKAAGKLLSQNITPVLEAEPYPEAATAADGRYAWDFRNGAVTGDVTLTGIGTPVVSTYASLNGSSGYKLSKDITLDGDATISVTCLFTIPTNVGGLFTSYDGDVTRDFVFYYLTQSTINIADPSGTVTVKLTETEDITPLLGTYNNYVIQKVGKIYSLYFNGKQIQSIFNGPEVLNINTLFFGTGGLGIKGKVKHCMIVRGSAIPPKETDPTFYSNNEQGTS
ncbi:MAG: sialate O-acetylesterase [Candidatus Pristimantibacillus sp.]